MSTAAPADSQLFTEREAAQFLRVSPGTLSVWRSTKRYPLRFVKIGYRVFYRLADLEAFVQRRTVDPTATEE